MSWTQNKTLLEYTPYTPCQEIFQAVCDEIGKHYQDKGFKYSRSRPKLAVEDEKIKLEIAFWSSRSNIPGESVSLEINPGFYAKQLKKESKTKGFLFGHTGIFYHKYLDDKTKIRVNQIFGDVLERTDQYSYESKIIDNNNCNVYAINEEKFKKIIDFIDLKILPWFSKIQTENGILELLDTASPTRLGALNAQDSNSNFVSYVQINFPHIDIRKALQIEE
jgi:hypothetical protein